MASTKTSTKKSTNIAEYFGVKEILLPEVLPEDIRAKLAPVLNEANIKKRGVGVNFVSEYASSGSKIATLLPHLVLAALSVVASKMAGNDTLVAIGKNTYYLPDAKGNLTVPTTGYISEIHLEKYASDTSKVVPPGRDGVAEEHASLFVYVFEKEDGTLGVQSMSYGEKNFGVQDFDAEVHGLDKLWVALIPYLSKDTEFSECIRKLEGAVKSGNTEQAMEALFVASDNVYRRYKNGDILQDFTYDNLPRLDTGGLCDTMYEPEVLLYGKFRVIDGDKAVAEGEAVDPSEGIEAYQGRYRLDVENQDKPASLPSWVKINPCAVEIAETIFSTSSCPLPIRNIMLAGPAGTGKSNIADQVAFMLGVPIERYAGNADMDIDAIKGEVGPVVVGEGENAKMLYLPRWTKFVKTFKEGGVFEFQEVSALRPGVLLGINEILQEGCLTVPCRDKDEVETIYRHPNAIFVFTTNVDYEGCRQINQSVIDRFLVYHIDELSVEEMCSRAMSASGLTDKVVALEMTKFVKEVAEQMARTGVDDGVCGMRSLITWMTLVACGQDIKKSCETAVINKTSFDREIRDSLREAQNHFSIFNRRGYANPRRRKK